MWYARSAMSPCAGAPRFGGAAAFFDEDTAFFAGAAFFFAGDAVFFAAFFADVAFLADFFAAFFSGPSAIDPSFDSQNLLHRQSPDLELCLVGLPGANCALQLMTGPAQRTRKRRTRVPLGPAEDLYRNSHASKRNCAVDRGTLQAGLARGDRAGDRRRQHRRHQVRSAAVVLLRRLVGFTVVLVGRNRLVLDAVPRRELAL